MNPERTWTIGELLDWTARFLADKGSESPRLDTEVLLSHALGCKRIELYTRYAETAGQPVRDQFRDLIRRRVEGCPVAYLVGRKEFFSMDLEVSPAVLIPRPESEFVVMECLRLTEPLAAPAILDIGTGSGNIVIAIAKRSAQAQLTAVDISPETLDMARRNAERHEVADRIEFLLGDLFAPVESRTFDCIVSNPPYIPHDEIQALAPGVRDHEPHLALDGGPDGFQVFERLVRQAKDHLKPGGWLVVEIGAPQEERARQILMECSFQLADTIHDHSGHPRVLAARLAEGSW